MFCEQLFIAEVAPSSVCPDLCPLGGKLISFIEAVAGSKMEPQQFHTYLSVLDLESYLKRAGYQGTALH
uniref:AlNc14C23G2385 protein n=1 Tax=Albugo laibachii Nc14 TaxID=890382 RepID=F0W686_9STRA|nr:AlNc14C23G2385 [Albugo laibachii Nc14]|eukprot:CCA16628.1 AlNc14C23G2385 [Albugo laibachii Nc14]